MAASADEQTFMAVTLTDCSWPATAGGTSPIADIGYNVSFRCWRLTPGNPLHSFKDFESRPTARVLIREHAQA